MNDFKKFTGDADDNVLTMALSNIICGVIIASGFLLAAILVAVSFLWGWIGFTSVIVPIDGSSYILNNCELLYTGITRAKKKCILIGDNSIIRKTINTKAVNTKQTYLKEMLLDCQNDTIEK